MEEHCQHHLVIQKQLMGETVPLAARLLTYQEVVTLCGGDGNPTSTGELDGCNYLMENITYSNGTLGTYKYWLETLYVGTLIIHGMWPPTVACRVPTLTWIATLGFVRRLKF